MLSHDPQNQETDFTLGVGGGRDLGEEGARGVQSN